MSPSHSPTDLACGSGVLLWAEEVRGATAAAESLLLTELLGGGGGTGVTGWTLPPSLGVSPTTGAGGVTAVVSRVALVAAWVPLFSCSLASQEGGSAWGEVVMGTEVAMTTG